MFDLNKLSCIDEFRCRLQSYTVLFYLLGDKELFCFKSRFCKSFNAFHFLNGEGDSVIFFDDNEALFIKGFKHDSFLADNGQQTTEALLENFPDGYDYLYEEQFEDEELSFIVWNLAGSWNQAQLKCPTDEMDETDLQDPDGAKALLSFFLMNPVGFAEFVSEYYERNLDLTVVKDIFKGRLISKDKALEINPQIDFQSLKKLAADFDFVN